MDYLRPLHALLRALRVKLRLPLSSISAGVTASLWELSLPARAPVDSPGATGEERVFRRGSFPESDSCKTTFRPARNLQ